MLLESKRLFVLCLVMALAACGSSETAMDTAETDSVEMMAEETMAADPMATEGMMDPMASEMATEAAM